MIAAGLAFVSFCLLASGVYVLNDVLDREADAAHPVKRRRPIAAGLIPVRHAVFAAVVLAVAGIAVGGAVARPVGMIGLSYFALATVYGVWLKKVVLVDVFAISAFFLLRLLGGAAAVEVRPSIWLLLCGGLLALYLGFAKRRQELVLVGDDGGTRSVLSHYSVAFLDQMSGVLLAVTIVAYIMYTLSSETAASVGSDALAYSTVFVLYGVFRYMYLVHQRDKGSPTETLLADPISMLNLLFWSAYCAWVLYRPF